MTTGPDLTKSFPRSPHAMLGGYVLAARALDKCRADLAGTIGEYHTNCPLDHIFLDFAGLEYADFRKIVESGQDDAGVAEWIKENSKKKGIEVIHFNNEWRCPTECRSSSRSIFRRTYRLW